MPASRLSARPAAADTPPPSPDLPAIVARLLVLACVLLLWRSAEIQAWALAHSSVSSAPLATPAAGDPTTLMLDRLAAIGQAAVASLLGALMRPPALWVIAGVALLGSGALLVELIWAAALLAVGRLARREGAYLAVRPLQAARSRPADPQSLWAALQPALADAQRARVPVALTFHARPDQPAELGICLAGGQVGDPLAVAAGVRRIEASDLWVTGRRRLAAVRAPAPPAPGPLTSLARALTVAIQGYDSEATVVPAADPLTAALVPGRTLAWQDLALARPAHLPLRPLDPPDALIPALAAALRPPAGVVALELQLIPAVRQEPATVAWRQRARRRLHALRRWRGRRGEDSDATEAKLADQRIDLSIRLVAVAADASARPAAVVALEALRQPFDQLRASGAPTAQRLVAAGFAPSRVALAGAAWWVPLSLPTVIMLGVSVLSGDIGLGLLLGALSAPAVLGWRHTRRRASARVAARGARLAPPPALILPRALWAPPAQLSRAEAATLWAIPAGERRAHLATQPNRIIAPPAHLIAPDGATDWLVLGSARRGDGQLAPMGLPLRSLRQILHLTAGVGAGKSQACAALIRQLIPWGCLVLDGKGDDGQSSLVATVRQLIPLAEEPRLILIDPLDADWPIGLNPLAGIDPRDPAGLTQGLGTLLSILARLDPNWSEAVGMRQYAQMAGALVIEAVPTPTLANVKQVLQDEAYRARLLQRCTNIEVRTFWETTFPKTSSQQKNSLDALLRRLDDPFVNELTRYLLTIPTPTVDLGAAMERGDILLFALPHNTLGELAQFVAMLVFFSIVRAAYRRPGSDLTRPTVPLIIDEFQIFAGRGGSTDVQASISQLRALGIGLVLAHQALSQLGELRDELLQNAANRLILRTGEPDASAYARMYANHGLTAADIAAQSPRNHQYAVLVGPDGAPAITSLQPLPWPQPARIALPPAAPQSWQDARAAAPAPWGCPLTDHEICDLVYRTDDIGAAAERLARLPDEAWATLLARWDAIRQAQRAHIVANPGCIPDRTDRQRWLSRLGYAWPRVLAAAAYQRQRWTIDPQEPRTPTAPRAPTPAAAGAAASSPSRPARSAIVPGLAPSHPPAAPAAGDAGAALSEFADLGEGDPS